jgi:large subunit ribosomal protein L18
MVSSSSLSKELREKISGMNKTDTAKLVGEDIAEKATATKIRSVVFDKAGYKYHGRVKAVAEGARSKGLEF